ncbi:hypothetical protein LEMLEM_LOCUS875 [Lemmus lemmus]
MSEEKKRKQKFKTKCEDRACRSYNPGLRGMQMGKTLESWEELLEVLKVEPLCMLELWVHPIPRQGTLETACLGLMLV